MTTAVVTGASRGIGAAIVRLLAADDGIDRIVAVARSQPRCASPKVQSFAVDCTEESALEALAIATARPVDLLVHCVGALAFGPRTPEKSLADLRADALSDAFRVNVIAAALVLKTFAKALRAAGGVAVLLSARVGSIADNCAGGWYGYRSSKAALNQLTHTAAIELGRGQHTARVVALHPGTTHTDLSAPFIAQREGVATPEQTAQRVLAVVRDVTAEQSGCYLDWDGTTLPW